MNARDPAAGERTAVLQRVCAGAVLLGYRAEPQRVELRECLGKGASFSLSTCFLQSRFVAVSHQSGYIARSAKSVISILHEAQTISCVRTPPKVRERAGVGSSRAGRS